MVSNQKCNIMEKVFNTTINNEQVLIKYKIGTGDKGNTVFSVETTIPNLPRFHFFIKNGNAAYIKTSVQENNLKMEIIKLINDNELKK